MHRGPAAVASSPATKRRARFRRALLRVSLPGILQPSPHAGWEPLDFWYFGARFGSRRPLQRPPGFAILRVPGGGLVSGLLAPGAVAPGAVAHDTPDALAKQGQDTEDQREVRKNCETHDIASRCFLSSIRSAGGSFRFAPAIAAWYRVMATGVPSGRIIPANFLTCSFTACYSEWCRVVPRPSAPTLGEYCKDLLTHTSRCRADYHSNQL